MYLLQILGPRCRVRHGHEETVGQYSEHYEQAKQCGREVKENALQNNKFKFNV